MTNPPIKITVVEDTSNDVWKLLSDNKEDLKGVIPIFKTEHVDQMEKRAFLVATMDKTIVGLSSLMKNSAHFDNAVGVGYICAHKEYRNMGVATAMVKALFTYAQIQGKNIANSPYEPDGKIYLEPVMQKVANKYPTVELIERDYWMS